MTKQAIMITALCTAAIWAYEMNGFPQDWQIILSCLPVRILAYATTAWCSKSEMKWFYYFGKFHVNTVYSLDVIKSRLQLHNSIKRPLCEFIMVAFTVKRQELHWLLIVLLKHVMSISLYLNCHVILRWTFVCCSKFNAFICCFLWRLCLFLRPFPKITVWYLVTRWYTR